METVYYDPKNPGSFGGIKSLRRYSKTNNDTARNWLASQDAFTLHKPVRRIFPRRRTFAKGIGDLYQADLCDLGNIARYNNGYRYFLSVIDVFSKRGYAVPIKTKGADNLVTAFEEIFSQFIPNYVQTDRGQEFLNIKVQNLFRHHNIKHYWSRNDDIKAAVVERFNRTIKTKLYRYFTYHHTNRWIDIIADIIEGYNASVHRSIKMAPNDVNLGNSDVVARQLYPIKTKTNWKFSLGDRVRISRLKNVFEKGYIQNWSHELFQIAIRYSSNPATYGLNDLDGEEIEGRFYDSELQSVNKQDKDLFVVERVIKTRRVSGKLQSFVKWLGYPDKFNSWTFDVQTI
jgi:hypothetical protein